MKAMNKMQNMKPLAKAKGFTIIELVVVILLLGILTATALPRFMDVTTQARTAVVQATAGGLTTGAALYRAQWFAEGGVSGATPTGWSIAVAGTTGYPNASDQAGCNAIYGDLLQAGAEPISTNATNYSAGACTFTFADSGYTQGILYSVSQGSATVN